MDSIMAELRKIIKLTEAQYYALLNGEEVEGYEGIDPHF